MLRAGRFLGSGPRMHLIPVFPSSLPPSGFLSCPNLLSPSLSSALLSHSAPYWWQCCKMPSSNEGRAGPVPAWLVPTAPLPWLQLKPFSCPETVLLALPWPSRATIPL